MVIDTKRAIGLFTQVLETLARTTPNDQAREIMILEVLSRRITNEFGRAVRMCEGLFDCGQDVN
jgi:hypothetical protein